MPNLSDLPAGTIWPHLLESIRESALHRVAEYIKTRKQAVDRQIETPRLAALLVDKYGTGLVDGFSIIGLEMDTEIAALVERGALEIDPSFSANRQARWNARPADLDLG